MAKLSNGTYTNAKRGPKPMIRTNSIRFDPHTRKRVKDKPSVKNAIPLDDEEQELVEKLANPVFKGSHRAVAKSMGLRSALPIMKRPNVQHAIKKALKKAGIRRTKVYKKMGMIMEKVGKFSDHHDDANAIKAAELIIKVLGDFAPEKRIIDSTHKELRIEYHETAVKTLGEKIGVFQTDKGRASVVDHPEKASRASGLPE